jgi:hypothetical protein
MPACTASEQELHLQAQGRERQGPLVAANSLNRSDFLSPIAETTGHTLSEQAARATRESYTSQMESSGLEGHKIGDFFSRESRPEEQPEHTTAKSFEKVATSPETRTSEGELKMPHGRIIQPSACFFKKGAAAGHAVDRESSRASRHQPILTHRYSSHLLAVAPIGPSAKEGLLKGIGRL